jgi:hypothetical protein
MSNAGCRLDDARAEFEKPKADSHELDLGEWVRLRIAPRAVSVSQQAVVCRISRIWLASACVVAVLTENVNVGYLEVIGQA